MTEGKRQFVPRRWTRDGEGAGANCSKLRAGNAETEGIGCGAK